MKPALFLHIQKTAGTSVQEMAREAYGNDQVISHGDFLKLGVEGCRPYNFVSGHFGYAFAQPLMEGRYCFTFLRDPIDRLLSLYDFCLTRDPAEHPIYAIAQKTDLEGFLSDAHGREHLSMIWNNQVWQMTYGWGHRMAGRPAVDPFAVDPADLLRQAKANLAKFDHVGFVANFDADISMIFRALGAPEFVSRWSNANPRAHRSSKLSSRVRSKIEQLTALDQELYAHALQTYLAPADTKRPREGLVARLAKPFNRTRG